MSYPRRTRADERTVRLLHSQKLQGAVPDACRRVWAALGAGHCEEFYSRALALALTSDDPTTQQARSEFEIPVLFCGEVVGVGRADVGYCPAPNNLVIIEAKRLGTNLQIANENQCRAYMRSARDLLPGVTITGFLVNFPTNGLELEMRPVSAFEPIDE